MPELSPLPPGSTIGILGAGQLGRMLVLAAARLGLKCHIYCDVHGPAMDVAATSTIAPYDDYDALSSFAASIEAATYEFENVPLACANHLAKLVTLRPGALALEVARDRLAEKTFIAGLGIPVTPFAEVNDAASLAALLAQWQAHTILKTRLLGYDGKGQISLSPDSIAENAFLAIGRQPAVLERRVTFKREVSVLLVRGADGTVDAYDSPENTHKNGILARSVIPSGLEPDAAAVVHKHARRIAEALDYVGLLTVEMFDLGDSVPIVDRFVVNEIAPRVHNSGHWTIEACIVSQFENHMRAVAGWPLGACSRHSDAEMVNLIGAEVLDWHQLAAEPGAALHLYNKGDARPVRKMGHVTRLRAKSD